MKNIRAVVIPWNPVNGTGLELRDDNGCLIGKLRLSVLQPSTADADATQRKDRATEIANHVAQAINGEDHHVTARVLPQHRS